MVSKAKPEVAWWLRACDFVIAHQTSESNAGDICAAQLCATPLWRPSERIRRQSICALHCGCKHAMCVKVLCADSVRRSLAEGRDPLACPAHDRGCPTFSEHVRHFADVVKGAGHQGIIIWDWHDLPSASALHFDATIMLKCWRSGGICARRFEIDGPQHFSHAHALRKPDDCKKDRLMDQVGAHCLRLHHGDKVTWPQCIVMHILEGGPLTSYTQAYARVCSPWQDCCGTHAPSWLGVTRL
jgi:hypothetical protein